MEQCGLCPAKSWSNADFAPRNHGPFVLCPTKSQRLRSLPRGIMEQYKLCSAKSWRHSFRSQRISLNLIFFSFFLNIFVNQCYFRYLYNPLYYFIRKDILCHRTFNAMYYTPRIILLALYAKYYKTRQSFTFQVLHAKMPCPMYYIPRASSKVRLSKYYLQSITGPEYYQVQLCVSAQL